MAAELSRRALPWQCWRSAANGATAHLSHNQGTGIAGIGLRADLLLVIFPRNFVIGAIQIAVRERLTARQRTGWWGCHASRTARIPHEPSASDVADFQRLLHRAHFCTSPDLETAPPARAVWLHGLTLAETDGWRRKRLVHARQASLAGRTLFLSTIRQASWRFMWKRARAREKREAERQTDR